MLILDSSSLFPLFLVPPSAFPFDLVSFVLTWLLSTPRSGSLSQNRKERSQGGKTGRIQEILKTSIDINSAVLAVDQ